MRKLLFIAVLAVSLTARAQYDVPFSHYWETEPYYNPAAVGKESKLNATGAYALDMAGFTHNPQTMYFAADMPFYFMKSYHGAGISFMNDKIGLFTHQRLQLQYAYKFKLFGGTLSPGIGIGLITESFDGSKLDLEDSSDPAFSSGKLDGNQFDIAAGLYYMRGAWYVGLSATHVTSPLVELGETNELQIDPTFYLTAGYNIKLRNPFLTIHPSAMLRYDGVGYRGDITARVQYTHEKRKMYAGVGWSPTNSVTAYIGGLFHGINIGYSYEMYTSAINPGNGSHELIIGYQTDINLVKKGKNKHKSVRHL
ncbi:MAG: type IX secretion system membrane protein PorP/SprF [Prevotella sp.]|nr:type IX secretion system membrane protein PorP/SprF [Prevotella sp.]MBQ9178503.1 type IX secretion system membrane protein PorP/SprF [Prevotella sp.]MBQ9670269.1 type IX secretion system membrane protein PorP/SprF [Prevotella sp.]MDY6229282.1 type IX secretion system membrane protein PorP/SprF [Prevotella sp.]MDY6409092.1 type IX secretion system membrane protein PorP/SprF [Prevotella sp.]